ncbi:MAG: VUT family protein [Coriobacteriales bacterium]|jgi:uncharacterized PurR-regulated membrane protein YhhQ (DUF165 family)
MLKRVVSDYKILLRNIPSGTVTLFVTSVIVMNLLANKELVSLPWLALDCGVTVSWVSFLCMDMICKRFGARASIQVSLLALVTNLAVCVLFWLMSLTPGMWGAYYDTGSLKVNDALNATFGGTWYVVFGSALAMFCSSITNSLLNEAVGKRTDHGGFGGFALRSYTSTFVGQFVDNFVFSSVVSHAFFGWTWEQVIACAITGALVELMCEVFLSPVGYRVVRGWERDGVGEGYLRMRATAAEKADVR